MTGASAVAGRALMFASPGHHVHPVTVNGSAGVVVVAAGRPVSVMSFTVVAGRIVTIDAVLGPDRLTAIDVTRLEAPIA